MGGEEIRHASRGVDRAVAVAFIICGRVEDLGIITGECMTNTKLKDHATKVMEADEGSSLYGRHRTWG